jgi:hypothetical protein
MPLQELFGGAITIETPQDYENVSEVRQVPDYQEVLVSTRSGAAVIVDLLSREGAVPDSEAGQYFYMDLAKANESIRTDVTTTKEVESPSDWPPPGGPGTMTEPFQQLLVGTQRVAKFNERGRENKVVVVMGIRRLPPPLSTDIVVSLSYAVDIAEGSSDAKNWEETMTEAEAVALGEAVFNSLRIVDYSLFIPEP